MPQSISEFKRISKALFSSYSMLQNDTHSQSLPGLKNLQEAEESFNSALRHLLSEKRSHK